jgi:teichuronic acid biosynthesis glycosyltransferase TuaH
MRLKFSRLQHKMAALRRLIADHGIGWVGSFLATRYVFRRLIPLFSTAAERRISSWVSNKTNPVHIYVSAVDWGYPYRQRPHHIASELVARGVPVVFVTPAIGYDRVVGIQEIQPNLLLTPHRDAAVLASRAPVVHLLSTDARFDKDFIELVARQGGIVVYDYIDALDDQLSSGVLTRERRQLHDQLLRQENGVAIVVTADALADEVRAVRSRGCALITNGGDSQRFRSAVREPNLRADFAAIVARKKPIVAYYGSFASWFDYDLVNALARARPNYSIVLIGPDLDGSRANFDLRLPNLAVLNAMAYEDLARHAVWFDVCLVPFLINEITLATSPLKIFEYMGLGKPTVSTDLPECRKYKSVLIGTAPEHFFSEVDRALELSTQPDFVALARTESEGNSWVRKVDDLLDLVNSTALAPAKPLDVS